jgi:hypothetical protein
VTARLQALLAGAFDSYAQRTMRRLTGLTDEEYLWEPVPGCWTVRGGVADGTWPPPDPPPVTTIAWRIVHICSFLQDHGLRSVAFGPAETAAAPPAPSDAAAAPAALDGAIAVWRRDLASVDDARLWAPMGPEAGPYADAPVASFVEHIHDEFVHHSAEVALLRDLYRGGGA